MPRPERIILPDRYPECCAVCPLMGTRPQEELQPGDKWTHICVWQDRLLSGRGSKQANARNRCKKKEYEFMYFSKQGRYPISKGKMEKYGLMQTRLFN